MENDSKVQEICKFYYIIMAATKSILSLKTVRMLCMVLDLVKITRRHNGNCLSTHKWTLSVWKSFRHGFVVILGNLVFLLLINVKQLASHIPANNYLFKGNNKNTRKRCKIYSRLIKKTSKHVIDVISYPRIRTSTFACQRLKNVSFSESFGYVWIIAK